jgi:hypothetical protein
MNKILNKIQHCKKKSTNLNFAKDELASKMKTMKTMILRKIRIPSILELASKMKMKILKKEKDEDDKNKDKDSLNIGFGIGIKDEENSEERSNDEDEESKDKESLDIELVLNQMMEMRGKISTDHYWRS